MPRFAANLTMLFTELPFLDRFAAAREAGFDGVEFLFPYDYAARDIAARLAGASVQRNAAGAAQQDLADATGTPRQSLVDATGTPRQSLGDATGTPSRSLGDATGTPSRSLGDATGTPSRSLGDATGTLRQSLGDATGTPLHALGDATGTPLQLVLFNMPPGDWAAGERGIACDPRRIEEFQQGVAKAIDYALALGVRQLHCMAGITPGHCARRQAHTAYINNLRYAAAACKPHGITVTIEPINTFDMHGYFLTGSEQAARVIAECGADNIKLQYDIYHMQRMEGELANTIRRHLPLIAHMQLADTPGRHEPGTGEIHYAYLFGLLDALPYSGWIGCEYHPQAGTLAGLGWRERLCRPV